MWAHTLSFPAGFFTCLHLIAPSSPQMGAVASVAVAMSLLTAAPAFADLGESVFNGNCGEHLSQPLGHWVAVQLAASSGGAQMGRDEMTQIAVSDRSQGCPGH